MVVDLDVEGMMCLPLARLYVSQQRNERLAGLAWRERWTERSDEVELWGSLVVAKGTGIYIDYVRQRLAGSMTPEFHAVQCMARARGCMKHHIHSITFFEQAQGMPQEARRERPFQNVDNVAIQELEARYSWLC